MATSAIIPNNPVTFTLALSPAISSPFNLPTISDRILPVINVAATFASGATGTVTVTGSTDGGSTFSAVSSIGSPSSLTASGTISVLQQPGMIFRVERAGGSGSVSVTASAFFVTLPMTGQVQPTTATASFVKPLAPSSLLPNITVAAAFTNGLTGSLSLTASTDGGATWGATAGVGGSPTILIANGSITVQQQANTLYRLEGTVMGLGPANKGTLAYLVSGASQPFSMPVITTYTAPPPPIIPYNTFPLFYAQAQFYNGAMGTATLTASTDGGQTFSPVTENGAALPILASSGQGTINMLPQANTVYRLEFSVTDLGAGSNGGVNYTIGAGVSIGAPNIVTLASVNMQSSPYGMSAPIVDQTLMTNAQVQKLFDAMHAPLTDSGISGLLTAYKACTYGTLNGDGSYTPAGTAIAKLSIPTSAQRARQRHAVIGLDRQIRAEYADVVSVVDEKGNSLAAGFSFVDPPKAGYTGTRYVPGQRVTSANLTLFNPSTGAFTDATNTSGIQCFATLIEAATCGGQFGKAGENHQPDLIALAA